ncbi:MAG: metalloregulator ArsR/SmtB family transcription factor [Pseudomonadota bacterium]
MHAFDVLGDPVRRRIIELLADSELTSGGIVEVIQQEFGITQAGVSQHLRVLREAGFATVRAEGVRRHYALATAPLQEIDIWLNRFRGFWEPKMESLSMEVARGKKERARSGGVGKKTPS